MSRQYWVAPVGPLTTADGTKNTFTTLVDVSTLPQCVIPANMLEIGSELEIQASGEVTNVSSATFTFGFYFGTGTGVSGVALAASTAFAPAATATAFPWVMRYRGIVRAIGTSGSIKGQGVLYAGSSLTAFAVRPIPETQAARTVTIDTTVSKVISFGSACGTSSASNSITCYDVSVKLVT